MRDWLSTTEAQLRQRDDSIRTLVARLEAYESQVLPSEQIAQELHAQWPATGQVTLAHADSTVLLIVSEKTSAADYAALMEEDLVRIENWLAIRLRTPSVRIIKVNDN